MTPTPSPAQSFNSHAALSGLAAQHRLAKHLGAWRADPVGRALARDLLGERFAELRLIRIVSPPSDAKPDFGAQASLMDGTLIELWVSVKNAHQGMGSGLTRGAHHLGRVRFAKARESGLLPENDERASGAILRHFIDGESLSRQEPEAREAAMAHFRASWALIARSALIGLSAPLATHIAISLSTESGEITLARGMGVERALALIGSEPPELSAPSEAQVGVIGSSWLHLQRGQALSLGEQKDIQIKINAAKLLESFGALES